MRVLPGGVNSPVRAFKAVGGTPPFITKGRGAVVTDLDENDYIDYVGSWGPLILGHADERVVAAVGKAASKGTSFGAPTERETRLAESVIAAVPSVEMVRFVNSGTEATMSAIRLARAFAGRDAIVKVHGGYHGHSDALLVAAGSGAMTLGTPSSPGIPKGTTAETLMVPFNDLASTRELFKTRGGTIAAIIVEPVAGNMGCVPPAEGYLAGLRTLCDEHGALLIFDEVMTGFRVGMGGAQTLYGVHPDLTCLGKIIGGGLPVGAYGGRRKIMEQISPIGPVYQAGTLSGNPLAMAAGYATLEALSEPGTYEQLEALSARLSDGLAEAAKRAGAQIHQARVGSMMGLFFSEQPVTDFESASACDTDAYRRFFHVMLNGGVYLAPSQFECAFVSLAHTEAQIDETVTVAQAAFEASM